MKISEKIILCRKKAGLSQEELAEKLSVSRQAVSKWETGESMPEITKLGAIAKVFGVTADYLIDDEQEIFESPACEKKAFIDKEASDRLSSFFHKYAWLSGFVLIAVGVLRTIRFLPGLSSFIGAAGVLGGAVYMNIISFAVVNIALTVAGIIIIVKLKPKKDE